MRIPADFIEEMNSQTPHYLALAIAVGFRAKPIDEDSKTDIIFISSTSPNRLEDLEKAMKLDGKPLGLVGVIVTTVKNVRAGMGQDTKNLVCSTETNHFFQTLPVVEENGPAYIVVPHVFEEYEQELREWMQRLLLGVSEELAETESWREWLPGPRLDVHEKRTPPEKTNSHSFKRKTPADLIKELDSEAPNVSWSAIAVAFEEHTFLVDSRDPNRLQTLTKYIENGGRPIGMIVVTDESRVTIPPFTHPAYSYIFCHRVFQEYEQEEWAHQLLSELPEEVVKMQSETYLSELTKQKRVQDAEKESSADRFAVSIQRCHKCGKPLPNEKQRESNRKVRNQFGQAVLDAIAEKRPRGFLYCVCPESRIPRFWPLSSILHLGQYMFGNQAAGWLDLVFPSDRRFRNSLASQKLDRLIEEIKYKANGKQRKKPRSLRGIEESTIRQDLKRAKDNYDKYIGRRLAIKERQGPIRNQAGRIICTAKGTSRLLFSGNALIKIDGKYKVTKCEWYLHGDDFMAKGGEIPDIPFDTPFRMRLSGEEWVATRHRDLDRRLEEAEKLFDDIFQRYMTTEEYDDLFPRIVKFANNWKDVEIPSLSGR